ncbi:hypothetical protein EUX98_g8143 [Antrodiella citrinella]|uniref:Uncharacterized protein n=1 Tax=Antrodiella citrinella TaxID=2447956 RepID=A0A4S4MC26_9APHY|nr:hypothetical protein EUX98_g8143 [Antrodiella citrinella]
MFPKYKEHQRLRGGHKAGILSAEFSPQGTYLATGCNAGQVCIWDVKEGELLHRLSGKEKSPVLCLLWTSDEEDTIICGLQDGTIGIISIQREKGQILFTGCITHGQPVECLAFEHVNQWIVSGAKDEVKVWKLSSDTISGIHDLPPPPSDSAIEASPVIVTSLSWRQSELLVTYMHHGIAIFDWAQRWRLVASYRGKGLIAAAQVSPDGCLVACSNIHNGYDVYDIRSQVPKFSLKQEVPLDRRLPTPISFIHEGAAIFTVQELVVADYEVLAISGFKNSTSDVFSLVTGIFNLDASENPVNVILWQAEKLEDGSSVSSDVVHSDVPSRSRLSWIQKVLHVLIGGLAALYLVALCIFAAVAGIAGPSMVNAIVKPLCQLPVVSLLCSSSSINYGQFEQNNAYDVRWADFPSLMATEVAALEDLFSESQSQTGSGLSRRIKKAQLSASAVAGFVKGSEIPGRDVLVPILDDIVQSANSSARCLLYFERRLHGALDHQDKQQVKDIVLVAFAESMTMIADHLSSLIMDGQQCFGDLLHLDNHLSLLHSALIQSAVADVLAQYVSQLDKIKSTVLDRLYTCEEVWESHFDNISKRLEELELSSESGIAQLSRDRSKHDKRISALETNSDKRYQDLLTGIQDSNRAKKSNPSASRQETGDQQWGIQTRQDASLDNYRSRLTSLETAVHDMENASDRLSLQVQKLDDSMRENERSLQQIHSAKARTTPHLKLSEEISRAGRALSESGQMRDFSHIDSSLRGDMAMTASHFSLASKYPRDDYLDRKLADSLSDVNQGYFQRGLHQEHLSDKDEGSLSNAHEDEGSLSYDDEARLSNDDGAHLSDGQEARVSNGEEASVSRHQSYRDQGHLFNRDQEGVSLDQLPHGPSEIDQDGQHNPGSLPCDAGGLFVTDQSDLYGVYRGGFSDNQDGRSDTYQCGLSDSDEGGLPVVNSAGLSDVSSAGLSSFTHRSSSEASDRILDVNSTRTSVNSITSSHSGFVQTVAGNANPVPSNSSRTKSHRNEENIEMPGLLQTSEVCKRHAMVDDMSAFQIEGNIILTTLGDPTSRTTHIPGSSARVNAQVAPPSEISENVDSTSQLRILSLLESQLHIFKAAVRDDQELKFVSPPTTLLQEPSHISSTEKCNQRFLEYSSWLDSTCQKLEGLETLGVVDVIGRKRGLMGLVHKEMARLQTVKFSNWASAQVDAKLYSLGGFEPRYQEAARPTPNPLIYRSDHYFQSKAWIPDFVLALLVMIAIVHSLGPVSRVHAHYILVTVKACLFGAFMYTNKAFGRNGLTDAQKILLDEMPVDVRTALQKLPNVEPCVVTYACCPTCFAVYPPNPERPLDPYPHTCSFQETDKPVCGAPLVTRVEDSGGSISFKPIKPYGYQSLFSWIATLFSRPGLERYLEAAWTSPSTRTQSDGRWRDIWDAPAIQEFKGPDGERLFSLQSNGSVHLVFSLFVDWFNPFGNKKAGKSHSVGAIYMACLNLPPHLRYLPENIYLAGIIPGPKEPSLHQLNHALSPLINDLLLLWTRGLFLTRTALCPAGRLLRAAMIPLVCDLPALRKTAGFAGHSSGSFCSYCRLRLHDINNLDQSQWGIGRRSWAAHMEAAKLWRDAPTERDRSAIFLEYGIRWSELLRLPYWDPTRFALIDAMHNLFLGTLRHHCMEVFGIQVKGGSGAAKTKPHTPEEQGLWLERVSKGIQRAGSRGALSAIMAARKGYVVAIAQLNQVTPPDKLTKRDYASALLLWYSESPGRNIVLPSVKDHDAADFSARDADISKAHILDFEVLAEVRSDLCKAFYPSWLERPPRNFGSIGHGKLKADQWRTVCTVSLVITLVRLWGTTEATVHEQKMLDNFLDLVIAVQHATRRSISTSDIDVYDYHIRNYMLGLRALYDHQLVPNHHLALHLSSFLSSFGVVHAWWGFPFERYNGAIGRLKTNSKTNEMPITFLRYFCIGANLRWFLATHRWVGDEFQDMLKGFSEAFGDATRGTLNADMGAMRSEVHVQQPVVYKDSKQRQLPLATYSELLKHVNRSGNSLFQRFPGSEPGVAVLNPSGNYVSGVHHGGAYYTCGTASLNNAFIMYWLADSDVLHAGQISHIFNHTRQENGHQIVDSFLLVHEYRNLSADHASHDPYRRYPGLYTHLRYNELDKALHFVPLCLIKSHFVAHIYTPPGIERECIVVLSVDRN